MQKLTTVAKLIKPSKGFVSSDTPGDNKSFAGNIYSKVSNPVTSMGVAQSMRVVLITMDAHLSSAAERAHKRLTRAVPGLSLTVHTAAQWSDKPDALLRCISDIGAADIVIVTMLFMEEHYLPVLPALKARREACDAMVCAMSAAEVMKLTRMGKFAMDGSVSGPMALLKRLKGHTKPKDGVNSKPGVSTGAQQMKMLRRVPKLLRFIPGTAQDVRAYFLTLQYWLAGSEDNMANLVLFLVDRYADGARRVLRGTFKVDTPIEYPELGVYHSLLTGKSSTGHMSEDASLLPSSKTQTKGTVGVLLMRSYLLAGNAAHYDGVIAALEAQGLRVIPAFATGLDARPAVERFFMQGDKPIVDAVVSLTGFSLVGGPAYNDAKAAEDTLAKLDVPYVAVMPVEFQTLDQWEQSERGLLPVEATMMVAIPELDGATGAMVFGGRGSGAQEAAHDMQPHAERAAMLAARVGKLIALRKAAKAERKVGVVLFNFPPNAGNTGTAAFLAVFESLFNTLKAMKQEGYLVEVPASVDELRERIINGNAQRYGAAANVHVRMSADEHVRRERHLKDIEAQWGPAPGKQQSDGASLFILGERFGNVFVGIQPSMGYEGDPMRLLFENGFAPTHAFSAFYRWLREDFGAHALLHFGTHGSLEFMPGKQAGMSSRCWPDRLIGDMPNLYLYAANNPSEGAIAKRRAGATLISYLTPPVAQAGLYKGLVDLKASLERWRAMPPDNECERASLSELIHTQAQALDLATADSTSLNTDEIQALNNKVLELEYSLIPHGLHVVGAVPTMEQRTETLKAIAEAHPLAQGGVAVSPEMIEQIAAGKPLNAELKQASEDLRTMLQELQRTNTLLQENSEIQGLLHALNGRFMRPAPGGDLLRTPDVLPTGRNLHGFDPFRLPSAYAVQDGARQAERLLKRYMNDGNAFPESIAMVLWGTDNLKSEGGPIGQALALMGAKPRFDSYGRLAGAELIALEQLGRPRVDVMITLSGIFRDLLPLQIKLMAEAAFLAASADEPIERNFIRKHALAYQAEHGGDLETASLRVFGNAEGAYGANVSSLVDSSRWDGEDELAETYTRRKGFAYGRSGRPQQDSALLNSVLSQVQLAYQNLDSVEVGVTTIDTYFDTLGGISRAVKRAKGSMEVAPVYIGDQTRGDGTVRTLSEQVALETRTRMLNPKWYESMLEHGYEGVRHIETAVTNTMGWSATTGQVQPWVYQQLTQTFMLDAAMRERLAKLNPTASAKVASRLLEASQRQYWKPDAATLEALHRAGEELEDRLEGVFEGAAIAAA
jgi:magnesium chelatase subunit H